MHRLVHLPYHSVLRAVVAVVQVGCAGTSGDNIRGSMARLALAYLAALRAVSVNAGMNQAAFVRAPLTAAARCKAPRWPSTRRCG